MTDYRTATYAELVERIEDVINMLGFEIEGRRRNGNDPTLGLAVDTRRMLETGEVD